MNIDQYTENIKITSAELEAEKKYWLEKLRGELILSAFPGKSSQADPGGRETAGYRMPDEIVTKLTAMSKNSPYALYMILVAVFDYLLYRYTGSEDIIVGMPVFKSKTGEESLTNMLLIRNTTDESFSFKDLLLQVKQTVTEADEYSNLPYHKLTELLNLENKGNQPLIKTVIMLENIHDGNSLQYVQTETLFSFTLGDESLELRVEFDGNRYGREFIDQAIKHLENVLNQVLQDTGRKLSGLEILSEPEKERILIGFNNTRANYPREKTIAGLFEEQAARVPDRPAISYEDRQLSYRELNERANQLAGTLRQQGTTPGSIVGIMTERSPEMIISMLAVVKSGGAYLPIDPDYPRERIEYMLEDSGAGILLTQQRFTERFDALENQIRIIDINNDENYRGETSNPQPVNKPDDLLYVIYTSGTTGKSKGAMIEHRNVVRLLFNDKMQFDFGEQDVWTMFHSFCFDFSVWEIYGALLCGGKLVIVPKQIAQDPGEYLKLLKRNQVTVLNQTPTAFYSLINEEMKTNDRGLKIRYVIFGGEALKPLMLKEWRLKYPGTKLINMYGITETTVHVTYKEITAGEIEQNISNIGKPIPTLTTYVMDRKQRLLPIGAVGELYVGGDGVGRGYLNRPELTAEKFIPNPFYNYYSRLQIADSILNDDSGVSFHTSTRLYKSGDLVKLLPDGDLEYYGRIDHQVKIRGHRIELGEIEAALLKHGPVREVVVLAGADAGNNQYICAYYVAETTLKATELREYLAGKLPDYMIPAYFIQLDKIPMTVNNKVDRKALPAPQSGISAGEEYEAPRNETETKLVSIWEEVLNAGRIGVRGNFFNLGGDSIKAIGLISKMNRELGTGIRIKDIYNCQTIKELAEYIETAGTQRIEDDLENGLAAIEALKQSVLADEKQVKCLPESYEDFYPISPIQQGMVFFTKLRPEEPIYHDQFPYLVKFEKFDRHIFNQAMRYLIKRHPILRTTFILEHFSEPLQIVHREDSGIVSPVAMDDLSNLNRPRQEQAIREYMEQDLRQKFQFENDIQWRMRLFNLGNNDYCLILSFQHAVLDGWSVASMMNELFEIYNVLLKGIEYRHENLKNSYKDYVALNISRKASEKVREYWRETMKGYSRNKLPFNLSGKKLNNLTGSRILQRELDGKLLKALEEKARYYTCAVKDICLAAHVYLLGIITTETDIVTGVVTHDRPALEDSEQVLGCYLNTIPIRVQVSGKIKKAGILETVKTAVRNIKANELFLADIARLIGERSSSGNPVFDTLHNFTDFHVLKSVESSGYVTKTGSEIKLKSSEMTNTLLDIEVSKTLERLSMQIKYAPGYFHGEEIRTTLDLYVRILEEFASDNDQYLRSEALLSREQIQELVYDFNNTQVPYPKEKTMHRLFEEQVLKNPDNIALVFGMEQLSYRELNEKANQLARILLEKGVESGDHVALITQRGPEMIIGMYAILKSGGAYVPIDPDYPLARRKYIMDNAKVSAVLMDKPYESEHENTIIIDYTEMDARATENLDLKKDSRDLAYVIYTSGSTGVPKGVMIEHHSAVNLILWVNKEFRVAETDRLLFITSMCFDLSVYDIFGLLAAGGQVVIARREQVQNPTELKQLLIDHRITFWDSVPSTMNFLVNSLEESGSEYIQENLRLVLMSGDWIPVRLPERLKKYFPQAGVISLGGATEGTVWSIYYPVEKVDEYQTSIPYGRPLANNYFYILDRDLNLAPKGVAGELYIGGVGVARGYMNDPERTAASFMRNRFLNNPGEMMYKTGDLGRMQPDGNIEFLGRIDHQVKIRGYRVELGEIESKLLKHLAVKDAVVVDKMDTGGNKYLCAYVVWNEEQAVPQMKEFLGRELPDYMIPNYFIGIDRIPLTFNGKIDRKSLPEPGGAINTGVEYVPPRNEIEAELAKIWREVLEVDRVGIHDNFFDIGGHSLKALTISDLCKKNGINLSIQAVFRHATIANICDNEDLSFDVTTIDSKIEDDRIQDENILETKEPVWEEKSVNFGKAAVKQLPIKLQREVNGYLHRAYPLCIILAHDNFLPWYHHQLIQIYAQIHDDGYTMVDYLEPEIFYTDIMDCINLGYGQLQDTDSIVNFLIDKVDNGCYIRICLDEFYLKGKLFFQKQHFVHEILIYGYDNNKRRFTGIGFDQSGIFTTFVFGYEVIAKAFESGKIYYRDTAPYAEELAIQIFHPKDTTREYLFNPGKFLCELNDYLNCRGNNHRMLFLFSPNMPWRPGNLILPEESLRYGSEVGHLILDRLERLAKGEVLIDYRAMHLVAEHKKGLLVKITYFANCYGIKGEASKAIAKFKDIVDEFEFIRVKSLQIQNADSKGTVLKILPNIIEKMRNGIEQEKLVLNELYGCFMSRFSGSTGNCNQGFMD